MHRFNPRLFTFVLPEKERKSRTVLRLTSYRYGALFLLHNPEYYLSWASRQGIDPATARAEYDRRIRAAFHCLEGEADRGRRRPRRGDGRRVQRVPVEE